MSHADSLTGFMLKMAPDVWRHFSRNGERTMRTLFHLVGAAGNHEVFTFANRTEEEEQLAALVIYGQALAHKAVAVGMIAEAWISTQDASSPDRRRPTSREPHERRESLLLVLQLQDGTDKFYTWPILRTEDGCTLGERTEESGLVYVLNVPNLLPRTGRPS